MAEVEEADWPELRLDDKHKEQKVVELLKPLRVTDIDMRKMMRIFETEMQLGMSANEEDRKRSSTRMFISHLYEVPNGTESGDFLALDVGGTNFRVLLVRLKNGKKIADTVIEFFDIPDGLLGGSGERLFAFMAKCVKLFIDKHREVFQTNLNDEGNLQAVGREFRFPKLGRAKLGFGFSFPMEHIDERKAVLLAWASKFHCTDTIGRDVTEMLQIELDKIHAGVDVIVNVNDAIGALVAGYFEDAQTRLAFILGTGMNGATFEPVGRIPKLLQIVRGTQLEQKSIMMESDCFALGDNGCIDFIINNTEWDRRVNEDTGGTVTLEKLCGGAFLGPLLRHILRDLMEQKLVFDSSASENVSCRDNGNVRALQEKFRQALPATEAMSAKTISDILLQPATKNDITKTFLTSILLSPTVCDVFQASSPDELISDDDCRITRYICSLISTRCAKICGALVAQHLLHNISDEDKHKGIAIALTGSVVEKHPTIRPEMEKFIKRFAPGYKFRFVVVKNGSGEGAAYCAAVYSRVQAK